MAVLTAVSVFGIISINTAPKKTVYKKEAPQEIAMVKKPKFRIAPEFSLKDVNGAEIKLSDFKNKVVAINFWATWCPSCRDEILELTSLYNQYKGEGLEVIGIAMDWNGKKVVPAFVAKNNINYTVLLGNEEVGDLFGGIAAIPTTVIIDKEGNIRKKYIGYEEKEVFEAKIKELL